MIATSPRTTPRREASPYVHQKNPISPRVLREPRNSAPSDVGSLEVVKVVVRVREVDSDILWFPRQYRQMLKITFCHCSSLSSLIFTLGHCTLTSGDTQLSSLACRSNADSSEASALGISESLATT